MRDGQLHFFASLNTPLGGFDPAVIDSVTPLPGAMPLGNPPILGETVEALKAVANAQAMGPHGLLATCQAQIGEGFFEYFAQLLRNNPC